MAVTEAVEVRFPNIHAVHDMIVDEVACLHVGEYTTTFRHGSPYAESDPVRPVVVQ
jgi:hypothetical protein